MVDWSRQGWPFNASLIPDLLATTRLVRVYGDEIMFAHRSIHEFMVARRLHDDPTRLLEALDLGETSIGEILRFAAGLSDEIAPLVDLLLIRERTLDAVTCLRFARVPNPALAAYVAVKLGHHIGDEFIRRLLQQISPDVHQISTVEVNRSASSVHDRLLELLDESCDRSRPNHERGARFELFVEAFFDGPFEPVERNWRTEHGELDLLMEIRGGTPYWDHWGADVLVECKNLATAAESNQVQAFAGKVAAARVKLAFMVSVNGFTADAMQAFRSQSRGNDRALIVPIAGEHIRQMLQRQSPIEAFIKDRIRDIQYERKFPRA